MKLKRLVLPALSLLIFLSACSSPLDKKYSEATLKEDMVAIRESNKLDTTEIAAMALYVVGAKFTGKNLEGKTYKEILDSAKVMRDNLKNAK
ncbi:hypothetical protein [Mucilaginibacter pedocola]|uniref:Lipoprotein n=1 Tax=Mucilaginibacter pedocola TaxID=1792845 RepID=A0A1S9PMF4_9SPHI|nr:hypothetical protein [Mucilaginibacter pedocola]OOQ62136.1 hypothetical protein BC343_03540 [Mucilaginibacter pedocola]